MCHLSLWTCNSFSERRRPWFQSWRRNFVWQINGKWTIKYACQYVQAKSSCFDEPIHNNQRSSCKCSRSFSFILHLRAFQQLRNDEESQMPSITNSWREWYSHSFKTQSHSFWDPFELEGLLIIRWRDIWPSAVL